MKKKNTSDVYREMSWEELYKEYGHKIDLDWTKNYTTAAIEEDKIPAGFGVLARNWVERVYILEDDKLSGIKSIYYGFDWVEKGYSENIKEEYSNNNFSWLLNRNYAKNFSYEITKGAVNTITYLATIDEHSKKCAVLIYALLADIEHNLAITGMIPAMLMGNVMVQAMNALSDECYWHPSMRRLIVAPASLYRDKKVYSYEDIFDIAAQVNKYLKENFEIIRYVTLDSKGEIIYPDND